MRRALRVLLDALASRTASFWVMGAWVALATVWLIPFQLTGQPTATITGIATAWLPFQVAYLALLSTTLACAILRLQRDLRRMRRGPAVDRALPEEAPSTSTGTLADARAVLEHDGFDIVATDDRLVASRRSWSLLGGSMFHLGVPLLAVGLAVHALTFGSVDLRLIEGQGADTVVKSVKTGEGRWQRLPAAAASLTLKEVQPSFFRDVLLFDRLDATLAETRTGRERPMSLASPLWLDPFTMLSIQDFGYAPRLQLVAADGKVVEETISAMNVFPPGEQDSVHLPVSGYGVSAVVYPDHAVRDGRDVSLSFNLREPRILIGVEQDYPVGMLRVRKLVKVGESVPGTDLMVRVAELRRFGVFRMWRSYGWPLVALAALLMLAGLTARFLFPYEQVVVWETAGGLGMAARVDGRPRAAGAEHFLAALSERIAEHRESGDDVASSDATSQGTDDRGGDGS